MFLFGAFARDRGVLVERDGAATLWWAEALDGGDWKTQVPKRDKLMAWKAPFEGEAVEITRTEQRTVDVSWSEKPGLALITDHDAIKHWTHTYAIRLDAPQSPFASSGIGAATTATRTRAILSFGRCPTASAWWSRTVTSSG